MDSNDGINSKDVLFSVCYNDTYIPLYDNVHRGKYIFKINNLDIWVSDADSRAVVGEEAGMFCTLIGITSLFSNLFQSNGLTTSSSIRIMSADYKNGKTCIHIVDVDCQNHITCLSKYY